MNCAGNADSLVTVDNGNAVVNTLKIVIVLTGR